MGPKVRVELVYAKLAHDVHRYEWRKSRLISSRASDGFRIGTRCLHRVRWGSKPGTMLG